MFIYSTVCGREERDKRLRERRETETTREEKRGEEREGGGREGEGEGTCGHCMGAGRQER